VQTFSLAQLLRWSYDRGGNPQRSSGGGSQSFAVGYRNDQGHWLGAIREPKGGLVALLAEAANIQPFGVCRCWLLHFPDHNSLEVAFSPTVSHDDVLDTYTWTSARDEPRSTNDPQTERGISQGIPERFATSWGSIAPAADGTCRRFFLARQPGHRIQRKCAD
jgi:hypothetical protein